MLVHLNLAIALEDRLCAALVAAGTNGMHWFAARFRLFKGISERPIAPLFQFVALLLSIPCSQAGNLLFKAVYALNQRRALLIRRKCSVLGIEHFGLEFEPLLLK